MYELKNLVDSQYLGELEEDSSFSNGVQPLLETVAMGPTSFAVATQGRVDPKTRERVQPSLKASTDGSVATELAIVMKQITNLKHLMLKVPPPDFFYTQAQLEYYFVEFRNSVFNEINNVLRFCARLALWKKNLDKAQYFHDHAERLRIMISAKTLNKRTYRYLAEKHLRVSIPSHVANAIPYRSDLLMIMQSELDDAYHMIGEAERFLIEIHAPTPEVLRTLEGKIAPIRRLLLYCLGPDPQTFGDLSRAIDAYAASYPDKINGQSTPALAGFSSTISAVVPAAMPMATVSAELGSNIRFSTIPQRLCTVIRALAGDATHPYLNDALKSVGSTS